MTAGAGPVAHICGFRLYVCLCWCVPSFHSEEHNTHWYSMAPYKCPGTPPPQYLPTLRLTYIKNNTQHADSLYSYLQLADRVYL